MQKCEKVSTLHRTTIYHRSIQQEAIASKKEEERTPSISVTSLGSYFSMPTA